MDIVQRDSEDDASKKYEDEDMSLLYEKLISHSSKWRDIGIFLGFHSAELDKIEAQPLKLANAPNSWLSAMLAQWLQWVPGDGRGSTIVANEDSLKHALIKAGLSDTAQTISSS